MQKNFSGPNFLAGFWQLADPKISLASIASIFLGACAAAKDGPVHPGWLAVTFLGIFAVEVAKNASGEIFDFDSGADSAVAPDDRSPFSGGKRVLVDGLLTRRQTILISLFFYLISIAAGLLIVYFREPAVLWLGLAGIACAYFYHAPPFKLSYRGLGELAVAICYGPLICTGTYLVQRGEITSPVAWLSVPLGLFIAAFLLINEFPDYSADRASGKKTLVVRLGRQKASRVFVMIMAIPFIILFGLPWLGLPKTVWIAAVSIFPAISACRRLLAEPEITSRIIPAQRLTLLSFVLFATGAGVGLLVTGTH